MRPGGAILLSGILQEQAEAVARERAKLVLVGVADLKLTRKAFWTKELLFSVSKAAGPGSLDPLYEAKGFDYPLSHVRWTERRTISRWPTWKRPCEMPPEYEHPCALPLRR